MRVGSLFAGIGGFDEGFRRAGMTTVWMVEIDPWCRRVLARHFPEAQLYEDVRTVGRDDLEPVDLICGGFPCQDLSVAGRRAGLAGERSGLFFEFMRIVAELTPRWVLIENVPGLLSSNGGRDMGTVLGTLAKLGYGYAYRVLDAQFFGVAQRRRRVFIVGCLGDAASAVKVLFEPESCERNTPPRRSSGKVAGTLAASGAGTSRPAGQGNELDFLVSHTLKAKANASHDPTHDTYIPVGFQGRDDLAHALRSQASRADKPTSSTYVVQGCNTLADGGGKRFDGVMVAPTLAAKNETANSSTTREVWMQQSVELFGAVRRLTPRECERLQGFPDDWTMIDGDKTPDAPRYRALGNAVAVPVAEWIGRRIMFVGASAQGPHRERAHAGRISCVR